MAVTPISILPTARGPSAFWYIDAEGAPSSSGARFHAALDWFASGGTVVHSAVTGVVVEVKASRGNSGQIFGGVVKVRESAAPRRIFVCRHIDPATAEGRRVDAGEAIGRVTLWADGVDHIHLEIWKNLYYRGGSGYHVENMIDPGNLSWRPYGTKPQPDFSNLPHSDTLRVVLGTRKWAGWPQCAGPLKWIAAHGIDPDQHHAALAWNHDVWDGPKDVTNVARNLVTRFLMGD
jgi:hypothetical protein